MSSYLAEQHIDPFTETLPDAAFDDTQIEGGCVDKDEDTETLLRIPGAAEGLGHIVRHAYELVQPGITEKTMPIHTTGQTMAKVLQASNIEIAHIHTDCKKIYYATTINGLMGDRKNEEELAFLQGQVDTRSNTRLLRRSIEAERTIGKRRGVIIDPDEVYEDMTSEWDKNEIPAMALKKLEKSVAAPIGMVSLQWANVKFDATRAKEAGVPSYVATPAMFNEFVIPALRRVLPESIRPEHLRQAYRFITAGTVMGLNAILDRTLDIEPVHAAPRAA